MLLGLGSRVYRDRRRLIFVIAMAFLTGFIMYLRADIHVYGVHVAWVTGAIYASVVGLCAIFISLFLPSIRFMMEAVAISRLGLSFVVFFAPGLGFPILASPTATALVVVCGGLIISRLLHGRIRKPKPTRLRDRFIPQNGFQRLPARIQAGPWQTRFVGWIDNTPPLAA